MMTEIADELLMLQYAQGDQQAFATLYRRHKNSLYRYFLRQMPDQAVAEELYQEVWSKLIKASSRYQVTSQFRTWLYAIAHNVLIDYYRSSTTQQKVIANNIEALEQDKQTATIYLSDPRHTAMDQEVYKEQQAKQLKWCLRQLPRQQQEAFLLKHEAGFTLNEITLLIDESSEAVKSRLRYALSKLRHCIMSKMGKIDER